MKRILVILGALALFALPGHAGNMEIKPYTIFGGSDTDSNETASLWFPVRGANRVEIRLWTSRAAVGAYAAVDADSLFSDSIATYRVAFTDSMLQAYPVFIAGDSVVFTATAGYQDTTFKLVAAAHPPVNKALRGPSNGSGVYTILYATAPVSVGAYGDGSMNPQWARIYVTPLRRKTPNTWNTTAPTRVNGLRGLRGQAQVIFQNR